MNETHTSKLVRELITGETIYLNQKRHTITKLEPYGTSHHSLIVSFNNHRPVVMDKLHKVSIATPPRYRVEDFRSAGLEARWGKHHGTPCIYARNPNSEHRHQRETWWLMDARMFERAREYGIMQAFHEATLIGDMFSI